MTTLGSTRTELFRAWVVRLAPCLVQQRAESAAPGKSTQVIRPQTIVVAVWVILLSSLGCTPTEDPQPPPMPTTGTASAPQCEDVENLFQRIECYASLATDKDDPSVCGQSSHEGVKYQCYAVLAVRRSSRELCDLIPLRSPDHQELRDICISDVAKKTMSPLLCAGIGTIGLKDSCYAKIGQATGDTTLCQKIQDPGLRSICTGESVIVD